MEGSGDQDAKSLIWPKAVDQHKLNKPLVPNSFGIIYVLVSVVYLFTLSSVEVDPVTQRRALALGSGLLFGGFLGLLDDFIDIKWRYKAWLPLIASLPLVALREGQTTLATYIFGKVNFDILFFIVIMPVIIAVATNTVNMLGGLNGLETVGPLLVLAGLSAASGNATLLLIPMLTLAILGYFNWHGRIFVGNVGTFAFGITAGSYAIIMNIEQALAISLIPYIVNSILTLFSVLILREFPKTFLTPEGKLYSTHVRSLRTLILHNRPMSERKCVTIICSLITISSFLGAVAR